jgi:hypothetical protein
MYVCMLCRYACVHTTYIHANTYVYMDTQAEASKREQAVTHAKREWINQAMTAQLEQVYTLMWLF